MPVEIRELTIKTTVTSKPQHSQPQAIDKATIRSIKAEIIEECFEKIRSELLKAKER